MLNKLFAENSLKLVVSISLGVFFLLTFTASPVLAEHCPGITHGAADNATPCTGFSGNQVTNPAGSDSGSTRLLNPLGEINSVEALLGALLAVVQVLAVPIIVFFIIYAGFLYVTARGNAEQTEKATRALLYAVVGGVIIIGATVLATIIGNLVDSFR